MRGREERVADWEMREEEVKRAEGEEGGGEGEMVAR